MRMNSDVFLTDPRTNSIPNDGVAKVVEPQTDEEWDVLRYELSSFVCEGEYERGLSRVLDTYLKNVDEPRQPAVWVSGFYGSGKSHFVRVLEYLWRDISFNGGVRARGLVRLPQDISDQLVELTTAGRRQGGLWSAAGTLSAGADSVRLRLLSIVFRSAGIPTQYAPARFVMWLRKNGYYDDVVAEVAKLGREMDSELKNMYVSPYLAQAILTVNPTFAASQAEAHALLRVQYPYRTDISDDEFLDAMQEVLESKSTSPGKLPHTLIIFDELQQFIGDDSKRTHDVQQVVEACTTHFQSRVLFIGTGQAALQSTPQLSKLQGRFTVPVILSDTDVEKVVRTVVLRKNQAMVPELRAVLDRASGEISRHLAGSNIQPVSADAADLVPDYPLLPVRRRFWERVLRAVDRAGTAGQLRTQLRIVQEATKAVADRPLGTVVAGDFIYDQLKTSMVQSGMLLRDMDTTIEQLKADPELGPLAARLCATTFLVGTLPSDGAATGIRATESTLADLLVEDLPAGSTELRQRIPGLLRALVARTILMNVGGEYRMQTQESAEWNKDFDGRLAQIKADESRMAGDRDKALHEAIWDELRRVTLAHGKSKTGRKCAPHFGADAPATGTDTVPVWVRDEWSVPEKTVRDDAHAAGTESAIVFVSLPQRNADALKAALVAHAAARETVESRHMPTTDVGREARSAMESRAKQEAEKVKKLVDDIVSNARIYLGGGSVVSDGTTLAERIRAACTAALARLFSKFSLGDDPRWATVAKKTRDGATDALATLDYTGDVEKHPVCSDVLQFVGTAGKKGLEVRKHFTAAPFGWPQEAADGALLVLVAGGHLQARRNGQALTVKQIDQGVLGNTDFQTEGQPLNVAQKLALRKLIQDMGLPCKPNEEAEALARVLQRLLDTAADAGGPMPSPRPPDTTYIQAIQSLAGNAQLMAAYEARERLLHDNAAWIAAKDRLAARRPHWETLKRLHHHAAGLPEADAVGVQIAAIEANRSLLDDPDPVTPLLATLTDALRTQLQLRYQRLTDGHEQQMAGLKATQEWAALQDGQRWTILAQQGLLPVAPPKVGTTEHLLATLNDSPLSEWDNMVNALPQRVSQARAAAATLVAPKSVVIKPKQATLHTMAELDAYIAALRAEIEPHIAEGTPVIL